MPCGKPGGGYVCRVREAEFLFYHLTCTHPVDIVNSISGGGLRAIMPPYKEQGLIEEKCKLIEYLVSALVLFLIIVGCFFVLRPFISALLWAIILSFSTWPVYKWWERLFKGRKTLAATVMTLLLTVALLIPVIVFGASFADEAATLVEKINTNKPRSELHIALRDPERRTP